MLNSLVRILKDVVSSISAGWLGIVLVVPLYKKISLNLLIISVAFGIIYYVVAVFLDKHLTYDNQ